MEYGLILMGGLLGSSHCVGMCGGFTLAIGAGTNRLRENVVRQLVYSLGRLFTYVFLGALVGLAGARLKDYAGTFVNVSAALSIFAGSLLVLQGLSTLGWLPRKSVAETGAPCLMGTYLRSYLLSSRLSDTLVAGILTGFLPCGLVYAFLALASASGHFLGGAAIMLAFGLGTIPLMLLTGVSASAISSSKRLQLFRAAALLVIVTGVLTISRGVAFAASKIESSPIPCPFCQNETNE